jgi:hypothetical protein
MASLLYTPYCDSADTFCVAQGTQEELEAINASEYEGEGTIVSETMPVAPCFADEYRLQN